MSLRGSTCRPTPSANSVIEGLVRMRPSGSSTTEQSAAAAIAASQARPGRDPVVVRIRPLEAHLIAREEVAQVVARRILRAADHDGQVQLLGRLVLQALDAQLDARDQPLLERVRVAHEQAELRRDRSARRGSA